MSKTYAILGGGGSFGVHTASYLLEHASPKKVIGIGRNPLRDKPFTLGIQDRPGYEFHPYHLTYELDLLLELLDRERPEVIINFAAQGEGAVSWKHSWRFFETNSMGLARLAEELMSRSWLQRFIQIGTSEMYGSVIKPSKETDPICPSSPYAASKVAFDMYLESIHRYLSFPMNIIRPSNAYGPGQLLHRLIPKAIVAGLSGHKFPLQGGGLAEKSYIHVKDLARAILLVAENAPLGEIYNVGPEYPNSIKSIVELIALELGMNFGDLCEITEDRLGQDSRYWLDSTKIRDGLGWYPEVTLEEGISQMVNWGKTYLDSLITYPSDYVLRG